MPARRPSPASQPLHAARGHAAAEADLSVFEPLCAVFRRALRAEGLKYTPERARILDAVSQAPEPFTADQVIAALKRAPGAGKVSKATVYRTIRLLADAGILNQVLLQADIAHYQLAYGRADTALLIRTDTHDARAVSAPELAAVAQRLCAEQGLTPDGFRFVIYARA